MSLGLILRQQQMVRRVAGWPTEGADGVDDDAQALPLMALLTE